MSATADGTVKLSFKPSSGDGFTEEFDVKAGEKKTVELTGLYPSTRYTVSATVTDRAGNTSSATSATFTTEAVTLELEVTDVTRNSAAVTAGFDAPGRLTISYSPYSPKESGTVLSNFRPADGVTEKSVDLTELKEKTSYTVTLTYTSDNDKSTTKRVTFTTDSISSDASLSSLQIAGTDGTITPWRLEQHLYRRHLGLGRQDRADHPHGKDDGAVIKVNGKPVKSGEPSEDMSITVGQELTATIEVTPKTARSRPIR